MRTVRLKPLSRVKYQNVEYEGQRCGVWAVYPQDNLEGTPFPVDKARALVRAYPTLLSPVWVMYKGKLVNPFKLVTVTKTVNVAKVEKEEVTQPQAAVAETEK